MTEPAAVLRISQPAELDSAAVLLIARGARVELAQELTQGLAARREQMLTALLDGRPVYGVNTGMGAQSGVTLTAEQQALHQHNLLLARAVGGRPWLSVRQARAVLACRLGSFLLGDAGVSTELIAALVDFLNDGLTPAIPAAGSGSAGEIIPLAHAFGPLAGIGSLLIKGRAVDAAQHLAELGRAPLALGLKEGVALIQGVPATAGLAILLAADARRLLSQMVTVTAISIVGAAASQDIYCAELARGDDELAQVNAALRSRLEGSDPAARSLQAPVSFRVAGACLAHLSRCITALERAIDRSLVAVTDSPAFVMGDFHATPGFHGLDLAAHLDAFTVALTTAAEVSAARTHRLLDGKVTGLNAQLAARPGPDAGLIAVHKRAVGVVHQMRRQAMSCVIGSMETSFGQEDVQSFGWEAAANAQAAHDAATQVLACELLVAGQACALRGSAPGSGLASALHSFAQTVPPIERDRLFGKDIEALQALLADGTALCGSGH